jgi:lipoprotein-anchoring transpeptidase ErfK/SrfK
VRSRSFIIIASILGAVFLGVGALMVYDQTKKDTIAEGVTVGGVEVGGMSRSEARDTISRTLRERARQPITVRDGTAHFALTPHGMGAEFDVNGMVDDAIARSRSGNIFSRTYREVRGKAPSDPDVPARVTYSKLVLARFINRVERTLNRKPVDAHLEFSNGKFLRVPGRRGVTVNSRTLHNQLESAITGLAPGTIRVKAVKRDPKVTMAELAKANPTIVVVDRPNFKLYLYKHLKLAKTYGVAVGAAGYDTPAGEYHIEDKTIDPTWYVPHSAWAGSLAGQVIPGGSPDNPLKARWLGFGGGRGIHGTAEDSSIGSAASHGCIRMHVPDVEALYPQVPLGAPLYIV